MATSPHLAKQTLSGAGYFMKGLELIAHPRLRGFVIIPLLVNILLFSGAFYWLFLQLDKWFEWINSYLPDYLHWLNYLLWPLALISVLVVFSFLFSTVANWIAAPFNGLLAEKTELLLTGQPLDTGGMLDLLKDLPRIFGREWKKLLYYLPRAVGLLLLFLIPVIGNLGAPLIWFLFSAWMISIQYCDYPFDNHKVAFIEMKNELRGHRGTALSFGSLVTLVTAIPVLNLLVMPVAVCGATAMWVDLYRHQFVK